MSHNEHIKDTEARDTNNKLAPFNPTNDQTMSVALDLFGFSHHERQHVLFDLGCGDARFLIQAALQFPQVRCVGMEVDATFVQRAQEAVHVLPQEVQDRIDIRHQDLCELIPKSEDKKDNNDSRGPEPSLHETRRPTPSEMRDLDLIQDATAIYLYLLPAGIQRIQPLLDVIVAQRKRERQHLDVIACTFQVRDWQPRVVVNSGKSGLIKTYHYQWKNETKEDENSPTIDKA